MLDCPEVEPALKHSTDFLGETHITHLLQKLDLRDRVQAVVLAHEAGLFDTDERPPMVSAPAG